MDKDELKLSPETHPLFPSGEWEGFYDYGPGSAKHRMDIVLLFSDSWVSGGGTDDVNLFRWEGSYDTEKLTCTMNKLYPTHSVYYKGEVDENGIWGTWSLYFGSGGFHIWPKAKGMQNHKKATNVNVRTVELETVSDLREIKSLFHSLNE